MGSEDAIAQNWAVKKKKGKSSALFDPRQ